MEMPEKDKRGGGDRNQLGKPPDHIVNLTAVKRGKKKKEELDEEDPLTQHGSEKVLTIAMGFCVREILC